MELCNWLHGVDPSPDALRQHGDYNEELGKQAQARGTQSPNSHKPNNSSLYTLCMKKFSCGLCCWSPQVALGGQCSEFSDQAVLIPAEKDATFWQWE